MKTIILCLTLLLVNQAQAQAQAEDNKQQSQTSNNLVFDVCSEQNAKIIHQEWVIFLQGQTITGLTTLITQLNEIKNK